MTTEEFGVSRFEILGRIAGWGTELADNARLWLQNFDEADRVTAAALLDSFVYVDNSTVDAMSCAAIAALAPTICATSDYSQASERWRKFLSTTIVTFPTGEVPNSTDSGYAFQRRARQLMEIPQQHIVEPREAIIHLRSNGGHVIFVDDLAGSGDQFIKTWCRKYRLDDGCISFEDIEDQIDAHFVPLFATHPGAAHIRARAASVNLLPVHQLRASHSALEPGSEIWNGQMRNDGIELVNRYSERLGIQTPWGYKDLGLCIAFAHSVPDATLPLFYHEGDDWRPLVVRR